MIPNSRIRCEMGVWSEIYFNHFHHLCMASEAKRPKIQPGRPLFTTAQPKTINEKAKTSLDIPKPTKKSSTGVIWIETLIVRNPRTVKLVRADQEIRSGIPAHRNTKQNTRNSKLKKTSTVHYFTDQWVFKLLWFFFVHKVHMWKYMKLLSIFHLNRG